MKRHIKKAIALITITVLCGLYAVEANGINTNSSNQRIVSSETTIADGYTVTVTVYEEINTADIIPLASTYEKTGKKTYTAKNDDGEVLLTFTVHGTFSVKSGVSATCTKASYSYSISHKAWEFKTASASHSSNKAVGDAEFIKKVAFITTKTLNPHVVLTCSNSGSLS